MLALAAWLWGVMLAQPAGGEPAPAPDDYEQAPPMEDTAPGGSPYQDVTSAGAEEPQGSHGKTAANGYIDSRTFFQRAKIGGLISTNQLPQLSELLEGNVQVRHDHAYHGFVYGDASLFGQFAGWYRGENAQGKEIGLGDQNLVQYQPLFSLRELYISQDILPQLNLTLGKKRIVWGSGFAFNPTDLMNPPKDPTNPTLQRSGFWMGRIEANFETFVLTFVAAPQVTGEAADVPFALVKYPSWNRVDTQAHFQLALRGYLLLLNSDINLIVYYGNRYNDAFANKVRFGASFSRYFFTDYELHIESLLQTGSTQYYPNSQCFADVAQALNCVDNNIPIRQQSRLHDDGVVGRLLVGSRRQFGDESMVNVEYMFQSDGYTKDQLQHFVYLLQLQGFLAMPAAGAQGTGSSLAGMTTFALTGRHYLIASYSKPKIFEDWTAALMLIASLSDLSTYIAPNIAWSVTDWLTLTLFGFVPAPGPSSLAVVATNGKHVSEFTIGNSYYRFVLEARLFY